MSETAGKTYKDIPGWFGRVDHDLFRAVLESQRDTDPGDLVEIGAYLGKSAVVIGDYLRPGEQFVVIDTFGDPQLLGIADDGAERARGRNYFESLTRGQFEANYRSVHADLPHVVQALSSDVVEHVEAGGARFVHVDGSHQYEDVATDCRSVKKLLRHDGVVVFDDWRKLDCPGVAAAVWDSALHDGLVPVAVTKRKLYGVYGDPAPLTAAVRALVEASHMRAKDVELFGRVVTVVGTAGRPRAARRRRASAPAPAPQQAARRGPRARLADDLLPPVLTRWVRSRRG